MTQNFWMRVGSGTGPTATAPVLSTASSICRADWSTTRWSYPFSLMRIFCLAIFPAYSFFDNLIFQVRRYRLVAMEFQRVGGAALRQGPQPGGVAERLGQGYLAVDDVHLALRVHLGDVPPLGVEVADDVAEELLRRHHLQLHDRLQQHGTGLLDAFPQRDGAGHLEGHLGGVHVVG